MYKMEGASILTYKNSYPKLSKGVFVASGARLIGDLEVKEESSFWFNVVVRADCNYIRIGSKTNVQDGSVIHVTNKYFPTIIADEVSIAHNVTIHGCQIGRGTLVGMGAIVMDGVEIGENCLVAAGSLVTPGKKFPDNSLIMGSPAKVVRPISEKEAMTLKRTTEYYIEYKNNYITTD